MLTSMGASSTASAGGSAIVIGGVILLVRSSLRGVKTRISSTTWLAIDGDVEAVVGFIGSDGPSSTGVNPTCPGGG